MNVKIDKNSQQIKAKISKGSQAMLIAVTEQLIDYATPLVPVAEGTLRDSALIASKPRQGLAIWDTPYAKKQYYTHESKNMWTEKAVAKHKKELNLVAQKAFEKGMSGE